MGLFPGALPSAGSASPSDTLATAGHTSLHNTGADESRALATKIGTGASTPTSGMVLRGNGAGTSAWAQVGLTTDVTGVLPVANGGTGTTLLTFPSGSDTLVGRATTDTLTNKTLTTPTIASFVNATHNHQNSAGGGQLSAAAISSLDLTNTTLKNPYKFYAYRNAAWTANSSPQKILFDAELYDTGNNFDSVTNNRFIAPIAGFYHFNWAVSSEQTSGTGYIAELYKNGASTVSGNAIISGQTSAFRVTSVGSVELQLAANDYIEVYYICGNNPGSAFATTTYLSGFLVSTT